MIHYTDNINTFVCKKYIPTGDIILYTYYDIQVPL